MFAVGYRIPYALCMPRAEKGRFSEVSPRPNIDEMERAILGRWEKEKTFEKSLEQNKDKPLFTFYDGPPYATGKPHYGHVLQSAIKDAVLRYKTMRGYYVPRIVGWDTHGLPVEVLIEKELGLRSKKDVEKYGIEKFNQKCREAVFRYIDEFSATLKRLGRWADYENGYATLDQDYMEAEWGVFKQLWEKELVYKDFRSTPYCIRCATPLSNFETSMAYRDKQDATVYVLFRVSERTSLLVWTTTPWTLPANVAVAFHPDIVYVAVETANGEVILAKDRVETVFGSGAKVLREVSHEELEGFTYEPLYPAQAEGTIYTVVPGDFVTTDEGTGLVHIAPAFGTEDFELARGRKLSIVRTVDTNGIFYKDVSQWGGMHIWKANPAITEDLKNRGLLFKQEDYTHSYPHCWRCDEPLIYYALDSWFVKVTQLKQDMLAANEKITWIPEHIKHGRFAKGIESAPDWAVSRNRFWSVPIPVWQCDACDEAVCVGSTNELQELSGAKDIKDLHRPYVDEITWKCSACEGTMKRTEEVLDVWFDSGSMPYTQPGFPADFIAESIEMTRAWFYVLHVLAVALKGEPAYKNVIGSGIIFGEDGNKLSKKLKNYPEIDPTLEQYGADTVRLFFLQSTLGEPYVFAEKELQQLFRNFTMTLWNVYSFFVQYAQATGFQSVEDIKSIRQPADQNPNILDRWILIKMKHLEYEVTAAMDAYRVDAAARLLTAFVDDVSNWYVRRSRERFQPSGTPEDAAFTTLHEVLIRFTRLLAPFMPFLSEEIYGNLTGEQSVHLAELSDVEALTEDERALNAMMERARDVVSKGLAARAAAGIKVRQPLESLAAKGVGELPAEVIDMIRDEVNVDNVTDASSDEVELNTEITSDLKSRGIAREIMRHGQTLRRKAGYALNDHITLVLHTEDIELQHIIAEHRNDVAATLQADEITESGSSDEKREVSIDGKTITIGVKK